MRQPGVGAPGTPGAPRARRFRADGGGAGTRGLEPDNGAAGAAGVLGASSPGGVPTPRSAGRELAGGQPVHEMPGQAGDEPPVSGRDRPAPEPGIDRPAPGHDDHPRLPPGQHVQARMPVLHYGPVPACNQQTWDLRVYGATEAGRGRPGTWDGFMALPRTAIIADFPRVTKVSGVGITWVGGPAAGLFRGLPSSTRANHGLV